MKLPKISFKVGDGKAGLMAKIFAPFSWLSSSGSREPLLTKFLLLLVMVSMGTSGSVFYFLHRQAKHAAHEHAEESLVKRGDGNVEEYEEIDEDALAEEGEEEHGGHGDEVAEHDSEGHAEDAHAEHSEHGDGHAEPSIEFNPLPDEVVKRQNGIPAAGYDLKEPEKSLFRELASAKPSDIEVRVGNYFVNLDVIYSNARVGNKSEGALVVNLSLETNNSAARNEVAERKEELRGLVNSILFEHQKTALLTHKGKMELKAKIQSEINHKLKNGKVIDVLLSEFHMRP